MEFQQIMLFICAVVVLAVIPGPDIIFVITQGITKGKKVAIYTALGLATGCIVHTTAAALGVSIIFQKSVIAFQLLKFFGVVYLLFLSYKAFCDNSKLDISKQGNNSAGYFRGILMNILNPKVAIFFLAFLPQFIPAGSKNMGVQMMILGIIFMIVTAVIFSIFAVLSATLGKIILKNENIQKYINKLSAGVYAILAVVLGLAQK